MSLKKLFIVRFGIQFLLVVVLMILTLLLFKNQRSLAKSRANHFESYLLADELRQSSDDLTRMARAYVVTGNAKFEREYWTVLSIRNGESPRPLNYNHIYWDFVEATGQKPRQDGKAISLHDLMVNEGFTQTEFDKLALAQRNSDGLVSTEKSAMNAVKGLFDDGSGNFTVKKKPDREMAIRIMFGEAYYKTKAEIMKPIDDFYLLFEKRTDADISKYENRSTNFLLGIIMIIALILGMFLLSFVAIKRQLTARDLAEENLIIANKELTYQITERKQAEEVLKESERVKSEHFERMNEAQHIAKLGSWEWNMQTNNVWWSDETYRIFGVTPQDFVPSFEANGKFIHPNDFARYGKSFEHSIQTGEPLDVDLRLVTNDGLLKHCHSKGEIIYDDSGQPINFIGTMMDITERKQAEKTLQENEERFRSLYENSTVGIYRTTPDGKIILANPTLVKLLGYSSFEELSERNLEKDGFEPSYERTHFMDALKRKGEVKGLESAWTRMDGTTLFVSESARAINDKEGKIVYYDGIVEDITLRKKAEQELIIANKDLTFQNEEKEKRANELLIANKELVFQNEEKEKRATELTIAKEQAEESDRLKSAFLTNMSHEIRTPMNGILGFTELLKEPNLSSDDQQDYIQTIQISGARMLNTINSIVDISKIESGLMKVDIKETNINEKMEFTYKFFKPEAEIKGLQLLFKNSLPAKKAIIKTDNEKVYGMLTNLIRNAIKFTYEGSIEFGYEKKGEYLEFFVKDTGIGIPQNQHKIIFERFRQGSESHNRGYEGSGLGLSIAKSYVEMLGGEIWVESEEGKGSIFYFTIPYNAVSEEKIEIVNAVSTEHKEVQLKNLKILIVEDDEISYSLLTRMLQKISKEVLHAITGVQAVEACRNNPDLDLVLMDIRMPKMDGNEATRQIRQFNKDVIIIAQTAYAFSGDKELAIEAGCNDYISKPINSTSLFELIRKHINK